MFRDLKPGGTIYAIRKDDKVEVDEMEVTSVSMPYLDTAKIGCVNHMMVDVTVNGGGKPTVYKTPENLSVAFCGGVTIVSDRDCLLKEIKSVRSQAIAIVESMDKNKAIAESAESLLARYSSEYRDKVESEDRMRRLEESMAELKEMITKLNNRQ